MSSTLDQWKEPMYGELLDKTTRKTPEGIYAVTFEPDPDAGTPKDRGDCYTKADVEAWNNDEWRFYTARVTFTHYDGREGTAVLGAIDAGEYFDRDKMPPRSRRSTYEQLMEVVLFEELDDEAYADLPERVFEVPVVAGKSFVVTFDSEGAGVVTEVNRVK